MGTQIFQFCNSAETSYDSSNLGIYFLILPSLDFFYP